MIFPDGTRSFVLSFHRFLFELCESMSTSHLGDLKIVSSLIHQRMYTHWNWCIIDNDSMKSSAITVTTVQQQQHKATTEYQKKNKSNTNEYIGCTALSISTKDCYSWLLRTINPYSSIQNHNTMLCYALLTQPIIVIAFSLFSFGSWTIWIIWLNHLEWLCFAWHRLQIVIGMLAKCLKNH